MPKRSYDDASAGAADGKLPPAKVQKTERTHEENQERAYIAASRRSDRSLEARVQSAQMASDIHRKRTGRGLRISEEIVLKEEMYEEMEDDMPRSYKYLTTHIETDSPEMNHRLSAYLVSRAAMASMANYNEINRRFSEAFPRAASFSQASQGSLYPCNTHRHSSPSIPYRPSSAVSNSTNHSTMVQPPMPKTTDSHIPNTDAPVLGASPAPTSISTPCLSPTATSLDTTLMETMEPTSTPQYQALPSAFSNYPLDPQLTQPANSSFTSELPNEVKMMADIDLSDPNLTSFLGENTSSACLVSGEGQEPTSLHYLDYGDPGGQSDIKTDSEIFLPAVDASKSQTKSWLDTSWPSDNFLIGSGTEGWDGFESFVNLEPEQ